MYHEQLALERHEMRKQIKTLESMLKSMEEDFAACVQGITPCLFCANDEDCVRSKNKKCNFKWNPVINQEENYE